MVEKFAAGFIPAAARPSMRRIHHEVTFWRSMKHLQQDPAAIATGSAEVLSNLIYGWGNEGWSAHPEYLQACVKAALNAKAPTLECGSGLSTVVLGCVAQQMGVTVWTLEHVPEWGERVQQSLDQFGIESVRVRVAPLENYGDFDWYAPPFDQMPVQFGTVVCDGPPSFTRGGRYGLVPVMKDRLQRGCVILLDDGEREEEQAIAERWASELQCPLVRHGAAKSFFELTLQS